MKAVCYTRYGPPEVLQLREVEKPVPRFGEVLIKVHATSVTNSDCIMRRAETPLSRLFLGLLRPRRPILGTEFAGVVEAVGKDVAKFKMGDNVYGFTGFRLGAYAEYVCLSQNGSLIEMPGNMDFQEAASIVDGSTTALSFLKDKAGIRKGQKALIIGASGSIGSAAVQVVKYFDAEVTAVCSSRSFDLVRSLGADRVIDYSKEDFSKNGERYDIIFDTVKKSSFAECKASLTDGGCYLTTDIRPKYYVQMLWTKLLGGKKVYCGMSIEKTDSLRTLNGLFASGHFRPVIDRHYRLEDIVEAHRYVESGQKKGNVAILVAMA